MYVIQLESNAWQGHILVGRSPTPARGRVGHHCYTRFCSAAGILQSNQIAAFKCLFTHAQLWNFTRLQCFVHLHCQKSTPNDNSIRAAMSEHSPRAIWEAATAAGRLLGYEKVKLHQLEVIKAFVKGSDVFGILPTGYGKSFCYASLPSIFDQLLGRPPGTTIVLVVSPLVAIMKDQVMLMK